MKNVLNLSLIFLAVSCGSKYKKDADLHVYNPKTQVFNKYNASFNNKECRIDVKYHSTISALDAVTNGWVCITPEEYSHRKAELKAACETQK